MFALKNSPRLRHGFEKTLNKSLFWQSFRQIRGRIRSQNENDFQKSTESEMEKFDEELDFSRNSIQLKEQMKQRPQLKDAMNENLDYYDSRSSRSSDLYERAKRMDSNNEQYFDNNRNSGQYYNNNKFNKYKSHRNRFDSNESYENDIDYDKDFDYRDTYNENRLKTQNYQRFNDRRNPFEDNRNQYKDRRNPFEDNRNQYKDRRNPFEDNRNQYNDRRNPFEEFDNRNRYNDRKQSRIYQNYKNRNNMNSINENDFKSYNDMNRFDFESGRPRFSRFGEQEWKRTRKDRQLQEFNNEEVVDRKELVDQKELDENESEDDEETERNLKTGKKLISIPYKVTPENKFEVLNHIVTPLHLKPYEYQLTIKYRKNVEVLQKLGKKLKAIDSPVVRDAKGLPCPLELVKPSPLTERYRNKDEYSIWPGVDGLRKTVGFFIGQPSIHHNVVCVEPDHIIVSKESHLSLAKKFQIYLNQISEYDSCENFGKGGNWRRFHVRSNDAGNHMAIAIMHPQDLTQQQLGAEMERIKQYFQGDPLITSLYFQATPHTRSNNEQAVFHHLFGDKTITESLFDKHFEISADSFFQINRSGAEVLYRNVISELNANKKTTVLDICCGTGTLAILVAPDVCRVIGIDSSQSAINDANKNASNNNVKNVSFIAGKVEEQLPKLMDEMYSQDIVVVANPTRGGLHSSVINILREMNFIHKIVYVSCKPEGDSFKNFVHLCMPSNNSNRQLGAPFVPTNAIPVDLFPHTDHCELIITFERF